MKPFLQLKKVTLLYPQQTAPVINNFSFDFFPGNVYALIGNNGSGKSTLLKAMSGLLPLYSGTINRSAQLKIGYAPEQCDLPEWLTINRFMHYNALLLNIPRDHIAKQVDQLLAAVNLLSNKNKLISTCSKGMKQRLCIAQALIGSPELLILDEPFSGLDQSSIELVEELCLRPTNNQSVIYSCHKPPAARLNSNNIFLENYHHQPNIRSVNSLEKMP